MNDDDNPTRLNVNEPNELVQLRAEVARLKNHLAEETNQRRVIEAERDALVVELAQARTDHGAEFARITSERTAALDNAQKVNDQFTRVCRRLCPIVVEWLTHYAAFRDEALTDSTREMKRDAIELVRLMTPFTE